MTASTAVESGKPRWGAAVLGIAMFAAGVAGTWLCWRYFVGTREGQLIDDAALRGSVIGQNLLWRIAEPVLDIVSVSFVVIVLVAAALIAVLRRRWLLAVQVTVLVGGANITTQVLKNIVLDRYHLVDTGGSGMNSLPSGHTTVAASVAAALLLVVPRAIRPPVAVLAAGYTAATGIATVVGGWHRPSDAVAAITVVLAWAGLTATLTALVSPERHRPGRPVESGAAVTAGLLCAGAGLAAVFAGAALARVREVLAGSEMTASALPREYLATAYAGAWLGIAAVSALAYAAILVSHQLASFDRTLARRPPTGPGMIT